MRHCVIIEQYDHTMTHFKAYIIVESFAKLVTTLLFSGWCGSTWACWTCWTGGECSLTWNILFLPSRWEVQHQKYLLTIRTHCSTPLLHNITTQTFCQRRFLYNFTPWGIITTHYEQSVIWPPVCFERPQCVLKSEDCSENYYVPLWQVNCKQTQTEKLHVSVWRWVVAPVSSVQYRENYIWL